MGTYIPSTKEEQRLLLDQVGCGTFEELFSAVPDEVKLKRPLDLPKGSSEMEVRSMMESIAGKNKIYRSIFRGAGAYDHYIPSIVKSVISKEEFITAYTPYQAEISQGVLQSIYEFQSMICSLTEMDSANASVYDGATAAAEAVSLCLEKKRNKVFISEGVNPQVIRVIKTYCHGNGGEVVCVPLNDGQTDCENLKMMLGEDSACVYIQQPNYYGVLENCDEVCKITHQTKAKLIMGVNPISLGILKTPGEIGADIAVGEGQPLGIPLSFGGPYLGFMACKSSLTRKLPGRIVGETVDMDGNRAYVLTLQAREQHIKREKASSNICSNEAYCALAAAVYMAAMGPGGLREAAKQCMSKAAYLADHLSEIGFPIKYQKEFFHEFVTECPIEPQRIIDALDRKGILGGLPLESGDILWCVTEKISKEQMDELAGILKGVLKDASHI